MNQDLQNIGDALEAAIGRDIARRNNVVTFRHVPVDHTHSPEEAAVLTETTLAETPNNHPIAPARSPRRKRSRRTVVAIAALATLGVGGAAAATAINLSSDEVSHGLPGGSVIFEGTDPSCTSTSDSNVFSCTLAHAPTEEVLDDYKGTLETFIDSTSHVAGGCVGETSDGLQWTCYAGQLAVDKEIIGPDLLGLFQSGPARG